MAQEKELLKFLQRFLGEVPVKDALFTVTHDAASNNKYDNLLSTMVICACHRLNTVLSHVLNSNLNDKSAAAEAIQSLVAMQYQVASYFRASPKLHDMLIKAQTGKVVNKEPVVPVGYISTPSTRWTYDALALTRCMRLIPYARSLDLDDSGWKDDKKEAYLKDVTAAKESMRQLQYVHVFIVHLAKWTTCLQSRTSPTITLVLRMLRDLRNAAGE